MTNEQLFKLLGNTDDALLDENVEVTTAAPKRRWIAWTAAAAACVCLCAVGAKVLPGMLPRSEEMTAATGDDTLCNNFWVPLENGIRYETVFCGTELEDPANFQAIEFILDPWHMEYQIIDPMAGGNAEIERGTYTVENGICTLVSPDGKMSQLQQIEDSSAWQWELKVLSCDSYPDYAGMVFTSKMNSLRPYEGMNTPDGVNADGAILNEAQTAQFCELLDAMIVYQSVSVPEDAPGRENAVRFSFLDQSTEDGLYTGITLFDQWICYDDGTGWLADAAQVAELMALYEEVQASSAADAEGWKPFAEMDASAFVSAGVTRIEGMQVANCHLETELDALVALLQEIPAYEQDPDFGNTVGASPFILHFEKADGTTREITIYDDHIMLDGVFYTAGSAACTAVTDWINERMNEGWKPFAEMDASEIPAAAVYYPSADAQEIQYLEKEVPDLVAMLQEFTAYGQYTATPEMGDTPYSIQFEYADGRYLQIGIYSEYLYISDSLGDTIYAADPEDCAALIEWMDAIRIGTVTEEPPFGEDGAVQPFAELAEGALVSGYLLSEADNNGFTIPSENLSTIEAALRELTVYTTDQESAAVRNTDVGWFRLEYTLADGTELSYRYTDADEQMIWIDGIFYWIYSEDHLALCSTATLHVVQDVTTIIAQITEINGSNITVSEYVFGGSCPQYTFSAEGLLMHDANGAEIALSDFAVGDTVYVSYTGEIQESDPAVIVTPTKLQLN